MSVSIEAVQAADIPDVLSFALQARDELFPTLSATGVPHDLAQFEGRIVASVAYRPYDGRFPQLNYQGRKTVEVVRLYVLPAARRLGLAGRLYRSLEALARADGVEMMYLHTHPFLPGAIDFWRRQGFEVVDVEADPIWQTTHMHRPL